MLIAAPRWAGCGAAAAALLGLAALIGSPQAVAATAPSSALQKLSVSLAPEMDAAKLDVSGPDGKATLTLPANLLESIRSEAGKAGVKAGSRVSVSAQLTGAGYDITPNGEQSSALSDGQALAFDWQVKATGAGRAPLSAAVNASLDGAGAARTFTLGVLTATPPAPAPATAAPAKAEKRGLMQRLSFSHLSLSSLSKLKLPDFNSLSLKQLQVPGHKTLTVPGLGAVPSQKVVTATILILVVLALMIIARNAGVRRSRAERRRRFRTFEGTGFGDETDHHET